MVLHVTGLPVEAEVPPGLNVAGALALLSVWLPLLLTGFLPPEYCLLLGLSLYAVASIAAAVSVYEAASLLRGLGLVEAPATKYAVKAVVLTPVTLAFAVYELLFNSMNKLRSLVSSVEECLDVDVVEDFKRVREPQPLDLMMVFVTLGLHTAFYAAKAQRLFRYIVYVSRRAEECRAGGKNAA